MIIAIIILALIIALAALYLLSLYPGKYRPEKLKYFRGKFIAHRGLFDNNQIPENSLTAFRCAADHGLAMELDVQLTADEELVVFHDESLKRMCNVNKNVSDCTYEELCGYSLLKTNMRIPLFSEVLQTVNGHAPLLIEVKPHGDVIATTTSLDRLLRDYKGEYAVQSFHPSVCAWYKKYRPHIPRGLLSTDYRKNNMKRPFYQQFLLTNLMVNFYARPDFIAYNHKYADQFSYKLARKLYKFDNAAWTIRNPRDLKKAKKTFNIFIFDSFIPF